MGQSDTSRVTPALDPVWVKPWPLDQGNARAAHLLETTFGVAADGVWSAPGRLNIIGEHTDYNNGLCLPTIIPHRTFAAVRLRQDSLLRVTSDAAEGLVGPGPVWEGDLDSISPEAAPGWPGYVAGALWALQEHGFSGYGMDIAFASCVPVGAGLSSSAALSCATALAANDLWKLALDTPEGRIELAEACIDGENLIALAPTGGLDHHTLLRCEEHEAIELDFDVSPPGAKPYPLYFPDYGLAILVIDTTVRHDSTDGQYGQRRAECERAAAELGLGSLRDLNRVPNGARLIEKLSDPVLRQRARHVYSENERVLVVEAELSGTGPAHERFVNLGKALYRSHASLDIDFDVSSPELNLAVEAAYRAEALGARLVGGGFGGAAIALIRRSHADSTARTINEAFAQANYAAPKFLLV